VPLPSGHNSSSRWNCVRGPERKRRYEHIASTNRAGNLADRTITASGDDQVRLAIEGRLPASLRLVAGDLVTGPCNQLDELISAMIVIARFRIVYQKHTHLPAGLQLPDRNES